MRVLFLQGPNTLFFARLAHRLRDLGHDVLRVNFCGGDRLFWPSLPSLDFTGPLESLPDFYEDLMLGASVDAVLMFGDRRPVHLAAGKIAERHDIPVFAFDEGYFRPHWFTMERGGTCGASSLPRDPDFYRGLATQLPEIEAECDVPAAWGRRLADEIAFNLWKAPWKWRYKNYTTHRPHPEYREALGWVSRAARRTVRRERYACNLRRVSALRSPFFFLPLQLDTDYQIRGHSSFSSMTAVVDRVLTSFAGHGESGTSLVIKNHPLDNGMIDYDSVIRKTARELGISDRVHYLEYASTPDLLRRCQGVVTVNSTVGLSGLVHGKPVKVNGESIYDLEGLTHKGDLDGFWRAPQAPDPMLFRDFRKAVIHLTQINGSFYSRRGQEMAVGPVIERLMGREMALARAVMMPFSAGKPMVPDLAVG